MRMRIGWLVVAVSLVLARSPVAGEEASAMRIRLTLDGSAIEATLLNNSTASDFLSLLPMTLTLEDYNATEKIGLLSSGSKARNLSSSIPPPARSSPSASRARSWSSQWTSTHFLRCCISRAPAARSSPQAHHLLWAFAVPRRPLPPELIGDDLGRLIPGGVARDPLMEGLCCPRCGD
jgi:hypothetical protein